MSATPVAASRTLRPRHQGKAIPPGEQLSVPTQASPAKKKKPNATYGKKGKSKRKREVIDTGSDVEEPKELDNPPPKITITIRPRKKLRKVEEIKSELIIGETAPEEKSTPKPIERVPTQVDVQQPDTNASSDTVATVRDSGVTRLATPPTQVSRRHYREHGLRDASLLTIHRHNSAYDRWLSSDPPASPCPKTAQRQFARTRTAKPEASHPEWIEENHFICKDKGQYHSVSHSLTEIRGGFRQPPDILAGADARKAWLGEEKYIVQEDMNPKYGVCDACNQAISPMDTTSDTMFDYVDEWVVHRNMCWQVLTKEDEDLGKKESFERAREISPEL